MGIPRLLLIQKLQGAGDSVRDFMIEEYSSYGYSSLIQLFGIESPGLTSSLSVAESRKSPLILEIFISYPGCSGKDSGTYRARFRNVNK